jgi:hypothetical protein
LHRATLVIVNKLLLVTAALLILATPGDACSICGEVVIPEDGSHSYWKSITKMKRE